MLRAETYLVSSRATGGASILTSWQDLEVVDDGAVAWRDGKILAVGPRLELEATYPEAHRLDAEGGVVVPGLVNLHHHFYSSLARGLDPGVSMADFPEVLDRLWWRLDRALDLHTVRLSAELAVLGCIRGGCTTVFDHHASPSAIEGSLDAVAEAVEQGGLSAVLCYEVTDRNGPDGARVGLEENLRFIHERQRHEHKEYGRIRGTLGLHASFTLKDQTLEAAAEERPTGSGCHIHVAEDPADGQFTAAELGAGLIERLERFGLLDDRALLAHGIHLEDGDYARIGECGATLLHNPESNANNGVGRLDVLQAQGQGAVVGLGTDGMSGDVLRALRTAFLLLRHGRRDPAVGFEGLPRLLADNARVASRFLDQPRLGFLEPGAPADLAVVDCLPPTPLHTGNAFGHLVYGLCDSPVRHTVAGGRILMRDFRVLSMDAGAVAESARRAAPELWRRFRELDYGTPYLG